VEENKNYNELQSNQSIFIKTKILDYLNYYKKKENKFKNLVYIFRILIFLVAMINTINLGINIFSENIQINIGLLLSALITFLTTMASFFKFDQYWMKNKVMVIKLLQIRDNFYFDEKSNNFNNERLLYYMEKFNK